LIWKRRTQRHTAKRIYRRPIDDHGADASERQVGWYVRERRRVLGLPVDEVLGDVCAHEPGVEARSIGAARTSCSPAHSRRVFPS
jgi:hypothetical protein